MLQYPHAAADDLVLPFVTFVNWGISRTSPLSRPVRPGWKAAYSYGREANLGLEIYDPAVLALRKETVKNDTGSQIRGGAEMNFPQNLSGGRAKKDPNAGPK
jgi:hypothetical protein